MKRLSIGLLLLGMLVSCGYRVEGPEERTYLSTISIPYISGDLEGQFTNELIHQLGASGAFKCVQNGGNLILKVNILSNINERLGFRYDRDDVSGHLRKNLVATEGRKVICAELTLIEAASEDILMGPSVITADAEFDYVDPSSLRDLSVTSPKGKIIPVISFSQGQLDTIENAQDEASLPLYRHLSRKIVDSILNHNLLSERP